jgi:diguanylate cyclase (GGDEF)-like protein/PAS domain S-box-containing protein
VVIGATFVLFALAVASMVGFLHEYDRSVARERTLRQAGKRLVASSGREEVYEAALDSMLSLVGPEEARLCLYDGQGDVLVLAGGVRSPMSGPRRVAASALPGIDRDALASGRALELDLGDRALHHNLKLPYAAAHVVVLPLLVRDDLLGFFVVAGRAPFSRPVRDTLLALASQAALGVESAALTEDLLRRKSEARFQSLVQNSSDLITVIDADSTIKYQSPSIQRVLGLEAQHLVGFKLAELLHPHEADRVLEVLTEGLDDTHRDTVECRLRHWNGSWLYFEIRRTNLLHDPNVAGIVLNSRDVTERKRFEDQLTHRAFHDPLTNLANRALFSDRVQHALSRKSRDPNSLSVVFIDLDDFKTINDSLGHGAGDRVLIEASARMLRCMRPMDTLARFGGDEFAVLLEDVGGPSEVGEVAERILKALQKPLTVEGKEVYVNASMGVAMVEGGDALTRSADELMRDADIAMYMAKRDGKGGYRVFEPGMHVGVVERLELKGDLQRALENGELELHYQPVVTLQTGKIGSLEALVRWNHPVRGLILPNQFIPLAEESGLIVALGRWVLRVACRQAKHLQECHPSDPPLGVGVNLSVRQLQEKDLVNHVVEALEGADLDPGSLTLEITESVLMSDPETTKAKLAELKAVGVRVAVDDFGTGYSSLSYLSQFPVDVLKIDRAFVEPVAEGVEESALAAAIVKLGDALHLQTVAEGIEDPEQMDRLLQLGCVVGQGFLFAEPMSLDETLRFLDSARAKVPPEPVS